MPRAFLLHLTACLVLVTALLAAPAGTHPPTGPTTIVASSRVVNGLLTQAFPTTGALLAVVSGGLFQICTGTLVGCQTFVTAAHCIGSTNPGHYRVFLQHAGVLPVASMRVHPSFQFGVRSDIAVLTLGTASTGIPPTPLNTIGTPGFGTSATLAGFGVTRGNANDSGLLRWGTVTTASCIGWVPQPAHLCWRFDAPLGPAGADSNTCSGDSGSPLFVDFGQGEVLAGVTSGGFSGDCLPDDLSFDTNVFENADFIRGVAGTDLDRTHCGSQSQLGEAGTTALALGSQALSATATRCRKEIRRQYGRYVSRALRFRRRCLAAVHDGSLSGPCPDAASAAKLARAARHVDPDRIARRCPPAAVAASLPTAGCAGAADARDLAACVLAAGDAAVAAMLSVEHVDPDPAGPMADEGDARCQAHVARAAGTYALRRLKALTKCQQDQDLGRVETCDDGRAGAAVARAAGRVRPAIEKACFDAQVARLDAAHGFGGSCAGASSTATLSACMLSEHDTAVDLLLALLEERPQASRTTFTVPAGLHSLRVTLNGVDTLPNDLDLYVRHDAPPTPAAFDFASRTLGVFEWITVPAPAAGTWHVLVERRAGTDVPFQLTVTQLAP